MPDVVARLEGGEHPRVADVGCGQGFSTVAVARAFLGAHVDGLDADPASVADAPRPAADAGLDGRVRFIEADAAGLPEHGRYDLVLILEALHDMAARPTPCRPRAPHSRPAAPSSWSTSAWPTPSPPPETRSSG